MAPHNGMHCGCLGVLFFDDALSMEGSQTAGRVVLTITLSYRKNGSETAKTKKLRPQSKCDPQKPASSQASTELPEGIDHQTLISPVSKLRRCESCPSLHTLDSGPTLRVLTSRKAIPGMRVISLVTFLFMYLFLISS